MLDAAYDLYATKREAFLRVILPLTIPGLFAAFLLTFIPALGDYVNQQILGGTGDTMIGTVIQNSFLTTLDYPGGSALSTVLPMMKGGESLQRWFELVAKFFSMLTGH